MARIDRDEKAHIVVGHQRVVDGSRGRFEPFLAGALHHTFLRLPGSPVALSRQIIDETRLPRWGGLIATWPEFGEVPTQHDITLIAERVEEKVNGVKRALESGSEENSKPAPLRQILAAIT